jgi:hypothetical protein
MNMSLNLAHYLASACAWTATSEVDWLSVLTLLLLPIQAPALLRAEGAFADLGAHIGRAGIVLAELPGRTEIVVSGSLQLNTPNLYWTSLTWASGSERFVRTFASPIRSGPESFMRLRAGDLDGDGWDELVSADKRGEIEVYDLEARASRARWSTPATAALELLLADLDGDGTPELLVLDGVQLLVYDGNGALLRSAPSAATALAAGALDADPALEIALTDGQVLDGATLALEWSRPELMHRALAIADLDADGAGEVLVLETAHLAAYRDGTNPALWRFHNNQWYNQRLEVVNLDADPYLEMVVGDEHQSRLQAWDGDFRNLEYDFDLLGHGVANFAFGDADRDGDLDLLWGSGESNTDDQYLHVRDVGSLALEWQSKMFVGPFSGPELGDPDGDGTQEVLILSRLTDGWECGRLTSLNAQTLEFEGTSDPISHPDPLVHPNEAFALCVADLDGDGRDEILVGGDGSPGGFLVVMRQAPWGSFSTLLGAPTLLEGGVSAIEVADLDGDLLPEVVIGIDAASNHQLSRVMILDRVTGGIAWDGGGIGGAQTRVEDLVLADVDADPALEIVVLVDGVRLVVYDGATHSLQSSVFGEFRSLAAIERPAQATLIAAGTDGGLVQLFVYSNGVLLPAGQLATAAAGAVNGLALVDVQGPLLLAGAGGSVLGFRPGASSPLTLASGYFAEVGRSMALGPGTPRLLVSVPYGLQVFSR